MQQSPLVAFANIAVGRLVIGIANPFDEEARLCSLIAESIEPRRLFDGAGLLDPQGSSC